MGCAFLKFSNKRHSHLFEKGLHAKRASISYGKVGPFCVRSVISQVHALGNDRISIYSMLVGDRTPCRRAF